MITNTIIHVVMSAVSALLSILPTLPAMDSGVVSAGSWVTTQVGAVIAVLNWIFTPSLMAAIVVIIVALFNFEWVYHSVMWIVHKIPIISVR
jgi:hypothetical protein